jgi:diaminopimelate epimerase
MLCGLARPGEEIFLRIWNADGSEAEMSGNGVRIFARALLDAKIWDRRGGTIVTAGAVVGCEFTERGEVVAEMAPAELEESALTVTTEFGPAVGHGASLGNPHFIIPVRAMPRDWRRRAATIAVHPKFPNRTNVHFLRVLDPRHIAIRIYERGAGETASCGSGAATCATLAHRHLGCASQLQVHMAGGILSVTLAENWIRILGPVVRIF